MTLKVIVKNVYGVDQIYPNCENSAIFAKIAGTKTLTMQTLKLAKQLGYTIEQSTTSMIEI